MSNIVLKEEVQVTVDENIKSIANDFMDTLIYAMNSIEESGELSEEDGVEFVEDMMVKLAKAINREGMSRKF